VSTRTFRIATGTGRFSDESEYRTTWYRPVAPAEALAVLLPDVDWEALRDELRYVDERDEIRSAVARTARRLLAVHDGKDGETE
jgi:hypothetical protein